MYKKYVLGKEASVVNAQLSGDLEKASGTEEEICFGEIEYGVGQ